ncbi:MAG: endonuclease/exonuclease/phosphatase family protein [Candidatus Promineifilaceae bacterium]
MTDAVYQPISKRSERPGDTAVTTFNLYNLFDEGRDVTVRIGGEWIRPSLPTQIAKLSLAIRHELNLPHILAVQEVSSQAVLQRLGDAVNAASGAAYRALSPSTSDRRGIQIGFLYDERRVKLARAYQMEGTAVAAAFGPHSPNPGREPLVGEFQVNGRNLTLINNHFKSNYIPDEYTAETQERLAANLAQRNAQARVVRDFVNTLLDRDPQALVLVTGDLNTSRRGGPEEAVVQPLRILAGRPSEPPLTSLLPLKRDIHEYTFIWEERNEILDHVLVSPALLALFAGVDVLHFNALYSEAEWLNGATAVRSSDHDPLEARFQFLNV